MNEEQNIREENKNIKEGLGAECTTPDAESNEQLPETLSKPAPSTTNLKPSLFLGFINR